MAYEPLKPLDTGYGPAAASDYSALFREGADHPMRTLVEAARQSTGSSIAFISVFDADAGTVTVEHLSKKGEPATPMEPLPIEQTFCKFVFAKRAAFSVPHATRDPRFADLPAVTEFGVGSYLGCPVFAPDGQLVASICVAMARPREWSDSDLECLTGLAEYATGYLAITTGISWMSSLAVKSRARVSDPKVYAHQFDNDLMLTSALLNGLANREFVPHYQPQVCARTGRLTGIEVLARWQRADGSFLAPPVFLERARRLSLLDQIDVQIFNRVIDDLASVKAAGVHPETVAFNATLETLGSDMVLTLARSVRALDVTPVFEVLESVSETDLTPELHHRLDRLREAGAKLALDDFGSQHASIVMMTRLRPDIVKLDKALVSTIASPEADDAVIKACITMAQSLHCLVVAEGIETREQAETAKALGCDILQGWHVGRPQSRRSLIEQRSPWHVNDPGAVTSAR